MCVLVILWCCIEYVFEEFGCVVEIVVIEGDLWVEMVDVVWEEFMFFFKFYVSVIFGEWDDLVIG